MLNRRAFKCRLKVSVDLHSRVLSGNEFQTDGAATENARREIWVLAQVQTIEARGKNVVVLALGAQRYVLVHSSMLALTSLGPCAYIWYIVSLKLLQMHFCVGLKIGRVASELRRSHPTICIVHAY